MFWANSLKRANLHWFCDCHFWPLLIQFNTAPKRIELQKWDWSQIEALYKGFHSITYFFTFDNRKLEKSLLKKTFFFFALSSIHHCVSGSQRPPTATRCYFVLQHITVIDSWQHPLSVMRSNQKLPPSQKTSFGLWKDSHSGQTKPTANSK